MPLMLRSQTLACSLLALTLLGGCTTKKYVRNQTAPVINGTNELDDKTAANSRALSDLDKRTAGGIGGAQSSANGAQQSATTANSSAQTAQQNAQDAVHRASSLGSVVSNLDSYKQVGDVSVNFAFNKSELSRQAKTQLDGLGAQLGAQRSYLLSLTGGTDSVGSPAYNYKLSNERAEAVVQYLAAKYGVPAHRFYLIGLGEDDAVASNSSAAGRAKNRRVDVQLLTNQQVDGASASTSPAPAAAQPASQPATGVSQPQ